MAAAMANGRCWVHGGPSPTGRANGSYWTGRYTKMAKAEREQAKALRLEAKQDARDGFLWLAKKKIEEALALELAWLDRHERIGPPKRRRPRRNPRFMPGGYPNTNGAGRFTKAALAAARAARLEAAFVQVALIERQIARRARGRPRKVPAKEPEKS
jgi:hypothetical protein